MAIAATWPPRPPTSATLWGSWGHLSAAGPGRPGSPIASSRRYRGPSAATASRGRPRRCIVQVSLGAPVSPRPLPAQLASTGSSAELGPAAMVESSLMACRERLSARSAAHYAACVPVVVRQPEQPPRCWAASALARRGMSPLPAPAASNSPRGGRAVRQVTWAGRRGARTAEREPPVLRCAAVWSPRRALPR